MSSITETAILAASTTGIMASPAPRGVGRSWLDRSVGWSRMARAASSLSTRPVPTHTATHAAAANNNVGSHHMALLITRPRPDRKVQKQSPFM